MPFHRPAVAASAAIGPRCRIDRRAPEHGDRSPSARPSADGRGAHDRRRDHSARIGRARIGRGALSRTARALVPLYALLCLLAGGIVPSLHAAAEAAPGWAASAPEEGGRDEAPRPEPHDHHHCVLCQASGGTPALPSGSGLDLAPRVVSAPAAPPLPAARTSRPAVSLPGSRAPPRA